MCVCVCGVFQKGALWRGVDFVVGTPGRVLDHMEHGNLILDKCRFLVLDEADRMLDMGFSDDVAKVVDALPSLAAYARGDTKEKAVQTLLFSATLPDWIKVCACVCLDVCAVCLAVYRGGGGRLWAWRQKYFARVG